MKGEVISYAEMEAIPDQTMHNIQHSLSRAGYELGNDGTADGWYVADLPAQVKLCHGAELRVCDVDIEAVQSYFDSLGYTLVVRVEPKYLEEN